MRRNEKSIPNDLTGAECHSALENAKYHTVPKHPPWEIRVGRKTEVLADFRVPAHKLQENARAAFLKALVARYSTDTPEEMLAFYVNKTRGAPDRSPFAEVRPCKDLDRRRIGYWCGDWECYAFAMQEIDAGYAEAMKRVIEQNKKTAKA